MTPSEYRCRLYVDPISSVEYLLEDEAVESARERANNEERCDSRDDSVSTVVRHVVVQVSKVTTTLSRAMAVIRTGLNGGGDEAGGMTNADKDSSKSVGVLDLTDEWNEAGVGGCMGLSSTSSSWADSPDSSAGMAGKGGLRSGSSYS